ncbi:hypothetical protein TRIATDRAFT_270860 [Trichoderma atroviride IMI 206040]|uniref:Heterokaryon incompatibility domain-containing protein n=1 Tax=Hypocrea atroviridis (strain ATCC 20476 / IMI 206040) TaxID=452589 RepID=G9NIU2_HYPAI|nr:uncharacterized protein TRIATDRAFT_270860 [Trichoderma atroviride IMI 206040]EHK49702.1 hypothetical protein TRIATDRAFT_270860 [Trichoderma atroviride IMI 206040]
MFLRIFETMSNVNFIPFDYNDEVSWHLRLSSVRTPTRRLPLPEPARLRAGSSVNGGYCVNCQTVGNFVSNQPLLNKIPRPKVSSGSDSYAKQYDKIHDTIRLGNLADLETNQDCICCQSIISALREQDEVTQAQLHDWEAELCWNGVIFCCILHRLNNNSVEALHLRQANVASDREYRHPKLVSFWKYNRLMDANKIDTSVIQKWIETCDRIHEPEAQSVAPLLSASELPWLYLIDLEKQCLVKVDTAQSPRYVTLSYVWGGVDMLKTTVNNLEQMLQPGALLDSQEMKRPKLAQTIVDAMDLARTLGCPFFWTDCICIVQDAEDERTMFLNGMGSIYANAYFTIVAGEGKDGNHGIPGIGRCSKPRNTLCSKIRFPGHSLFLTPRTDKATALKSPAVYCTDKEWSTRGWTLQESYLSRRLLVFTSVVSFHCQKHTSVEWELATHGEGRFPINRTSFACNVPNWPNINHFITVAEEYSQKRLSFDDDMLHAFAGITTVLKPAFHSGFHYGLPEVFFDASLLWESDWRRPDPPQLRKTQKLSLPSWSWVRMKGSISTSNWRLFAKDFYKETSSSRRFHELKPRVKWWKTGSKGEALELIEYQHFNDHASMPPGWNRLRGRFLESYRHPLSPRTRYSYPFPFPDSAEANSPDIQYGPILHFNAKRGWLLKSNKLEQDNGNKKIYGVFNLCVGDGTWAGILIDDRLDQSFTQRSDEKCEVIAIAEGRIFCIRNYIDWPELAMPLQAPFLGRPRPKLHGTFTNLDDFCYEFYFILWIGWIDGIAYRRGIGRVFKSIWESMDLEEIQVDLG